MAILNLTQHAATADQVADGVVEPTDKAAVQALLTFEEMPQYLDVCRRAAALAEMAKVSGFTSVMIGGAPFFMAPLETALESLLITPYYSFTRRESVDVPQGDGSVKKTQVFKHVGFVESMIFDPHMLELE